MDKDKDLLYNIDDEEQTAGKRSRKGTSESDKPLYVIEDEGDVDPENDDCDSSEENHAPGSKNAFMLMLQILVSPVEGWKSLKRQYWNQEILGSRLFYPILAVATMLKFIMEMFIDGREVTVAVTSSIVVFITFFFGYFLMQLVAGIIMPKESAEKLKTDFGKCFLMMNFSTLVLFFIIYELLPMLSAVTFFLPIWTIYIICRGIRFLRVPKDKEISTTVLTCILVLGVPVFCSWCFEIIF